MILHKRTSFVWWVICENTWEIPRDVITRALSRKYFVATRWRRRRLSQNSTLRRTNTKPKTTTVSGSLSWKGNEQCFCTSLEHSQSQIHGHLSAYVWRSVQTCQTSPNRKTNAFQVHNDVFSILSPTVLSILKIRGSYNKYVDLPCLGSTFVNWVLPTICLSSDAIMWTIEHNRRHNKSTYEAVSTSG